MTLDTEIDEIVTTVWSALVDIPIQRAQRAPRTCDTGPGEATATGIVSIDGAWRGAVLVQCDHVLASLVTATMYQSDGEPTFDEVRDALGELTNMVAGNVKALLPQPSSLSLPTVAFGSQYEISVVGTRIVATVPFSSDGHRLLVSIVQRIGDVEGGA